MKSACAVCGELTEFCCSDCAIHFQESVFNCLRKKCQDAHDKTCDEKLRAVGYTVEYGNGFRVISGSPRRKARMSSGLVVSMGTVAESTHVVARTGPRQGKKMHCAGDKRQRG